MKPLLFVLFKMVISIITKIYILICKSFYPWIGVVFGIFTTNTDLHLKQRKPRRESETDPFEPRHSIST